jgi:hypothetical protein
MAENVSSEQYKTLFLALLKDEYGISSTAYNYIWGLANENKDVYDALNSIDEMVKSNLNINERVHIPS